MTINRTITDGRFKGCRWIEADSVEAFRPRFAFDVIWFRPNRWYVDDCQDKTTQGIVLRLPKSRGFLAGCSDPWNRGNPPNCAVMIDNAVYGTEKEAAQQADECARIYGEACVKDDMRVNFT